MMASIMHLAQIKIFLIAFLIIDFTDNSKITIFHVLLKNYSFIFIFIIFNLLN